MKIIYCFAFLLLLLMKNGYCVEEEKPADDIPAEEEEQSQFESVPMAENPKEELQQALKNKDDNADTQGINLTFKPNKGLIITLSPEGGFKGNGLTYTRWGRTRCPSGATKIYDGYAGAGWYNQRGNGANYLCLVKDPTYLSSAAPHAPSHLYGAEYESNNRVFPGTTHNYNVPCVVCQVPRLSKLLIPGKVECPRSWTREYYGYLMASHHNHYQTINYECVDRQPEVISGSGSDRNGALFYFVQAACNHGLPCGPFRNNRATTCAICTQ